MKTTTIVSAVRQRLIRRSSRAVKSCSVIAPPAEAPYDITGERGKNHTAQEYAQAGTPASGKAKPQDRGFGERGSVRGEAQNSRLACCKGPCHLL
jgi:hypothetical protein